MTFATDCSQLVKIVSEPEEWYAFATYVEEIQVLKESFRSFKIKCVPRTQNSMGDNHARGARLQQAPFVHIDTKTPFG